MNAEGDVSARAALQNNGIIFDKPSGTEWRKIADTAMENLAKVDAYPVDTYKALLKTLEEYRATQASQ